jgi:hypothetical protein
MAGHSGGDGHANAAESNGRQDLGRGRSLSPGQTAAAGPDIDPRVIKLCRVFVGIYD